MTFLVDTNVILRWVDLEDPGSPTAVAAVMALHDHGARICVSTQNLTEFWNVATRPRVVNGFGMTPQAVDLDLSRIEGFFELLHDGPEVYREWRRLVASHGVCGRQVYDARLAASMRTNKVTYLLTFNNADFHRYPGVIAVHPKDVAPAP